eukprot:7116790-Prymnesium_polylepis.1
MSFNPWFLQSTPGGASMSAHISLPQSEDGSASRGEVGCALQVLEHSLVDTSHRIPSMDVVRTPSRVPPERSAVPVGLASVGRSTARGWFDHAAMLAPLCARLGTALASAVAARQGEHGASVLRCCPGPALAERRQFSKARS